MMLGFMIAPSLVAGCWLAALEAAPMAVGAVQAVSGGVINAAQDSKSKGQLKPGEDEASYHERCDNLEQTPPSVIELRANDNGGDRQWRNLQIGSSSGEPVWSPAYAENGGNWRATEHLNEMKFAPPLALSAKNKGSDYLAYAPAEPRTPDEQDQLTDLNSDFGMDGTFQWQGRAYAYAVVGKLPCFRLDTAMK